MIIAVLEIENYKQYLGSHRIEFPEQGIIAVTGPNGAGKTTLFEAIEWCLYCPRSIPQSSVPPHDGVGRTVVRVTLQDLEDGKRYCVQRELRANGTQAEIYLEDQPEQSLVQGTREVSRYVASHLIGLPHGAFVSTFFTKQKELQFFGDRSATERRTEVGRLLGLEAVREAQREIGEGRTAERSRADSLREEYERRLGDRDLAAESERAAREVKDAEALEAAFEQESLNLAAAADLARETLDRLRTLQTDAAALGHEIAEVTGASGAAAARRDAAANEMLRLELRATERMELAEAASRVAELAEATEQYGRERDRARHLQDLQSAHRQATEITQGVVRQLEQVVDEQREAAVGLAGWDWTAEDRREPVVAANRLHAITVALEPEERRRRAGQLQEAARCAETARQLELQVRQYCLFRDTLTRERDEIVAAGDPKTHFALATQTVRDARETEHLARSAISAARVEMTDIETLVAGLRQHVEEPICPTCTRPLGRPEAQRLLTRLDERQAKLTAERRDLEERVQAATEQVKTAERVLADAQGRLEKVREFDGRLADGQKLIDETESRHRAAVAAVRAALEVIGACEAPSPEDIAAAQRCAEQTQQIAGLAGLLRRLHEEASAATKAREVAEERIGELGEVHYDQEAHRRTEEALAEARRAAAQVEQIDIELAHRPRYESQHGRELHVLSELAVRQAALVAKREALAFDPASLQSALVTDQAARVAAHDARDRHVAARHAVREAQFAQERLEAEHTHLQSLIDEADRKNREADDLTRMYEEFSDFDRYVARHVGPLLAETAERMLGQVTNGKYDHLQFDENYGIQVFDGDEAFPLGGFSGGERDVVALCARLALSEVVGSSALRPPRFLVLDEVFGSLDSERRGLLLETLGSLAHSGHFRQMFIISHVDDVQQSPVMNEAWTIDERDGVSQILRPEPIFASAP